MRNFLMLACVVVCIASVGCCGPMGCGPGCGIPVGCNDCDGRGVGQVCNERPLMNLKRQLVCGSGCGEAYVGEWMSTPPDAQDPCCGNQWVGGASKCRPFCWERGTILRGLYGGRYCTGEQSSTPCGCGVSACGGGCGSQVVSGSYISDDYNYVETGNVVAPSSSCSTCDSRNSVVPRTRVARKSSSVEDARLDRRMYR